MRSSRLVTLTCYASFLALGMSSTLLGPMFESLTTQFHIALKDAGILTALVFFGSTLSAPFYGRLLDRVDGRYVLCGGAVVMGIGLLLLSVAPTLAIGLFATLLLGLGAGALVLAPNVVIVALNPDNAAGALNFLNVFFGVGAIVGPQVVNFALSHHNFTLAFQVAGVFTLLLVIPFGLTPIHIRHQDHGKAGTSIAWLTLLPFAIMSFIYVGTESGFGNWLFTQLTKVSHSTDADATIATSIFYVGLTLGRLIASFISRYLSEKQLMGICIVILGVGVALILGIPAVQFSVVSAFIVGLGCAPMSPTIMAIATNAYPASRGTVLGLNSAAASIGGAALTWFQGQVGGGVNGGMIVPLVAACILLVILLTFKTPMPAGAPQFEATAD